MQERDRVRIVVMLSPVFKAQHPKRPKMRGAAPDALQGSWRVEAVEALQEIDRILAHDQGKRLSEQPDALGTVAVETTPPGVFALAQSDRVKVILEDQGITRG